MAAKTSIKDVARVMSYPIDKSNALTRLVPDHMPIDPRDPKKEKELKRMRSSTSGDSTSP